MYLHQNAFLQDIQKFDILQNAKTAPLLKYRFSSSWYPFPFQTQGEKMVLIKKKYENLCNCIASTMMFLFLSISKFLKNISLLAELKIDISRYAIKE